MFANTKCGVENKFIQKYNPFVFTERLTKFRSGYQECYSVFLERFMCNAIEWLVLDMLQSTRHSLYIVQD